MKNIAVSLAVSLLVGSNNARVQKNNKALAEEYLRKVYAQVGETYLAQTETDIERRRRRRVIKKEEYKDYHNIYPPVEGAIAKLRGDPWPCTEKEPCGEGEGTCFNPYETRSHPDALCAEPFFCQDRVGGSRGGAGEKVLGVDFTGALKMHHMGANDICYDDEWETYGKPNRKMAVLRRKLVPCTHENPCDVGEGDCGNDNDKCNLGLTCAFRADEQTAEGEPLHGIEFTGDLLRNAAGANDLCYNPHWPNTPDASYEGKVVRSCDAGGNNCADPKYLVLDGERRPIDAETFGGLWGDEGVVIEKPEDAFKDLPVTHDMCPNTPVISSAGMPKEHYLMIDGKRRHIDNDATYTHLRLKTGISTVMPQCAFDALEEGIPINYSEEDGAIAGSDLQVKETTEEHKEEKKEEKKEEVKEVKKEEKKEEVKQAAPAYDGYLEFEMVGNDGGADKGTKPPIGADTFLSQLHLCYNGKHIARGEQVESNRNNKEVQRQNFGKPDTGDKSLKCDQPWSKVSKSRCYTKATVCTDDTDKPYVNGIILYKKHGGSDTFAGSKGCYGKKHEMDTDGGCIVSLKGRTGSVADKLGFYYNKQNYWGKTEYWGGKGGSDKGSKAPLTHNAYLAEVDFCIQSDKHVSNGEQVTKIDNGPTQKQRFGRSHRTDDKCHKETATKDNCFNSAYVCVKEGSVNRLSLTRRDGSEAKWAGSKGQDCEEHKWNVPGNGCITTITGRTGDWADSVGFYYTK